MSYLGKVVLALFGVFFLFSLVSALDIDACQELNVSGNYTLTGTVFDTNNTAPVCFTVTAPNVTFDCQGNTILSAVPVKTAFYTTASLTVIQNCNVRMLGSDAQGIHAQNASGVFVFNNTFMNVSQPIVLDQSRGFISKNTFRSTGKSIALFDSSGSTLRDLQFFNVGSLVLIDHSNDVSIERVSADACLATTCIQIQDSNDVFLAQLYLHNPSEGFLYISGNSTFTSMIQSALVRDTSFVVDLDDGSGTGVSDGVLTDADTRYFLAQFEAGTLEADVDDGTMTGTQDGGVDISDLLYFLQKYDQQERLSDIAVRGLNNTFIAGGVDYAGSELVEPTNLLERWWYYGAFVMTGNIPNRTAVYNATVTITNGLDFNRTYHTNAQGSILQQVIRSYRATEAGRVFDAYTITAFKEGYLPYEDSGSGILANRTDEIILALDDFGGGQNQTSNLTQEVSGTENRTSHRSRDGSCVTSWTCNAWSVCIEGRQTRVCEPASPICFADPRLKPAETQQCPIPLTNPETSVLESLPTGIITGAVVGAQGAVDAGIIVITLLLLVVLALYVLMRRARGAEQHKLAKGLRILESVLLGLILLLIIVMLFNP